MTVNLTKENMKAALLSYLESIFRLKEVKSARIRDIVINRENMNMAAEKGFEAGYNDAYSDTDLYLKIQLPEDGTVTAEEYLKRIDRFGVNTETALGWMFVPENCMYRIIFKDGMRYDLGFEFEYADDAALTLEAPDAKITDKLGHKWGAWTELNDEQHRRVCEHDPAHTETEAHKWDDGVVAKEATTKENGEKLFTCSVCKATRTETIPRKDIDDITPSDDTADDADEDKDLPVIDINKVNTVGNFKKKQMKIVFPANKKVDNYRIQYRLAGKKSWSNGWSKGTGTYIVKNLKKYSLCEFRIEGYVKQADGTWIRSKWSKVSYRYVSSTPIKTIKAGKKSIKLTWKKEDKSDGYKIQYSLKKNMAGRKTITVNGKSTTKYTIKKLKKGKTYYIKIRPIKKKSGKTYIGILSGTKKAKVK